MICKFKLSLEGEVGNDGAVATIEQFMARLRQAANEFPEISIERPMLTHIVMIVVAEPEAPEEPHK